MAEAFTGVVIAHNVISQNTIKRTIINVIGVQADSINFINFKNTFQHFEQKVGKFYFIYLQFQTKNN